MTTTITSTQNPRLQALRRLQTRRGRGTSGRFAAEGEDLLQAAASAGREAVEGFRLAGSGLGDLGFHDVESDALANASTLGSGTRVIGVYEQRWAPAPSGRLCVYLHGVRDPGNVGTVLRSAQAFGASCVALGPGCADPHSPKAVRASMGAIFAVPLARAESPGELPGMRIALSAGGPEPLSTVIVPGGDPVSLLIGSEREGLPGEIIDACDRHARIPIESESLNAAMAATVALYEVTRQDGGAGRRQDTPSQNRSSRVTAS